MRPDIKMIKKHINQAFRFVPFSDVEQLIKYIVELEKRADEMAEFYSKKECIIQGGVTRIQCSKDNDLPLLKLAREFLEWRKQ